LPIASLTFPIHFFSQPTSPGSAPYPPRSTHRIPGFFFLPRPCSFGASSPAPPHLSAFPPCRTLPLQSLPTGGQVFRFFSPRPPSGADSPAPSIRFPLAPISLLAVSSFHQPPPSLCRPATLAGGTSGRSVGRSLLDEAFLSFAPPPRLRLGDILLTNLLAPPSWSHTFALFFGTSRFVPLFVSRFGSQTTTRCGFQKQSLPEYL